MPSLLDPIDLRGLRCPNRVFMAPLTRQRASQPGDLPGELQAEHYAQRASYGLLIAEATWITEEGKGYPNTPGVRTPEQVAGWRIVTDRVHAAGGRIFLQLWHVGRVSHCEYQPGGGAPVSSAAVASKAMITLVRADGTRERVPATLPRALRTDEMPRVVEDYAHAARNAKAAGFDGVEVHAANSYLINQFLSGSLNRRDDAWGGSVENRLRLLLEATHAAAEAFGYARVGVRLSPMGSVTDLPPADDDREVYVRAARELGRAGCAYLHLFNHFWGERGWEGPFDLALAQEMKREFGGPVVMNGYGRDVAAAQHDLDRGLADAVAFGKLAISNPDLPERIARGAGLAAWDESTFYASGAAGYNDYARMK
ncbi:MAG: alkene reductase [Planctomycetes bacterium]|nr:alkene reductase [Planctomycetota bacterium]